MQSILAGVVLIAIGFVLGESVFLGDFSVRSIIFDGLGVFFVIRGLVRINRAKQAAAMPPASPPSAPPPPRR